MTARPAATVERLGEFDAPDRQSFVSIYEAAFPADERVDEPTLFASVRTGERLVWAAHVDGVLAGFAVVLDLGPIDVALLEFIAVDPDRRSGGIGSRLLHTMQADLRATRPDLSTLVFEVEPPEDATDEASRQQRDRRVAFYLANHATRLDTAGAYRVPSATGPETLRFELYTLPLTGTPPPLRGPALRRTVEAILHHSYGLAVDDPRIPALVGGLP